MFTTPTSPIFLALTIADLAMLLLSIILCLDVVWRTKGKLDIFAKLLTAGVVVRAIERFIPLMQFNQTQEWLSWPGLITDLILMIAFAELYRIVKSLDGEI